MTRLLALTLLLAAALPGAGAERLHLGKSLESWTEDLASSDRMTRLLAARAIGEMGIAGDDGALEVLTSALSNEDSAARYWSAVALGEMGDHAGAARPVLQKALQDEAAEVRVWAAYALVRQGRPADGMPALIEVLGDAERGARLQAITALDQLGEAGRPAAAQMKKAVGDELDYVGRIARHALWKLGERACPYRDCD